VDSVSSSVNVTVPEGELPTSSATLEGAAALEDTTTTASEDSAAPETTLFTVEAVVATLLSEATTTVCKEIIKDCPCSTVATPALESAAVAPLAVVPLPLPEPAAAVSTRVYVAPAVPSQPSAVAVNPSSRVVVSGSDEGLVNPLRWKRRRSGGVWEGMLVGLGLGWAVVVVVLL